jgi:two-component system response regulator RegA
MALAGATTRALTKRGFVVQHCASLAAARDMHSEGVFALALLDLRLDDGSSLDLIEHLIAQSPKIKILVLTGYASIATAVQAIKLGAVNYLSKPASIEQILRAFDDQEEPSEIAGDEVLPLRRREWEHIQQILLENHGNISATARQLKMHRRTLQRKLSKKPVAE